MSISSNQQILICIIIGIIVIFFLYNRSEDFAPSTESVNIISSLYNAANLTATNIKVTGDISSTGTTHFTGMGTDTWFPFTDGKNYIRGPLQIDETTTYEKDITVDGKITTRDKICIGSSCIDENFLKLILERNKQKIVDGVSTPAPSAPAPPLDGLATLSI
jgi:hypothetical protein